MKKRHTRKIATSAAKANQIACKTRNSTSHLLPKLADGHVHIAVLLHNLRYGHLEVFLCHVDASLPQREHPRLRADSLRKAPADRIQVSMRTDRVESKVSCFMTIVQSCSGSATLQRYFTSEQNDPFTRFTPIYLQYWT